MSSESCSWYENPVGLKPVRVRLPLLVQDEKKDTTGSVLFAFLLVRAQFRYKAA